MPVGRWKQGNSREATHLPSCAGCNWAHTALAGWPAAKAAGFFLAFRQEKSQISFEAGLAPLELPRGSVAAQSAKHRSCGKHFPLSLDKKKPDFIRGGSCPPRAPLRLCCRSECKTQKLRETSFLVFRQEKAGFHSRRVLPPSSSPAALLPLRVQNTEAAENILPCLSTRKSQISFEAEKAVPCIDNLSLPGLS